MRAHMIRNPTASTSSENSPESDLTKSPADPRAVVLLWLVALTFHDRVSVLVPGAIGEIVPKHGSGGLGFWNDPESHVTLGEAHQGFLNMARGLVARHHDLEPVDGADKILLALVIAADGHFLGGKLIASAFDLAPCARGVFAVGKFAHHLFERRDRPLGAPLVAVDVGNLV